MHRETITRNYPESAEVHYSRVWSEWRSVLPAEAREAEDLLQTACWSIRFALKKMKEMLENHHFEVRTFLVFSAVRRSWAHTATTVW